MLLRRLAPVLVACWLLPRSLAAQSAVPVPRSDLGVYRPDTRNPQGREVVAVFISSSTCIANRDTAFKPAVREMMRRLGHQRDSSGTLITITGVSTDWSPREGFDYLAGLGTFDEVVAGRNWFNSAVTRHLWQAPNGRGIIPQVVLVERTVQDMKRSTRVTGERELARFVGGDAILEWVARGAPVPPARPAGRKTQRSAPAT